MCELVLDYFSHILEAIPDYKELSSTEAWNNYIKEITLKSKALTDYFNKHRSWYIGELAEMFSEKIVII